MVSNKNKRFVIALLLTLTLCLFFGYQYIYQNHRNIKVEKPKFIITSEALIGEFSKNSIIAEKKYLNKVLEISGLISEIENNTLVLDNSVFCLFKSTISNTTAIDKPIRIKGRCIGFDNLLKEIKLDQCSIIY